MFTLGFGSTRVAYDGVLGPFGLFMLGFGSTWVAYDGVRVHSGHLCLGSVRSGCLHWSSGPLVLLMLGFGPTRCVYAGVRVRSDGLRVYVVVQVRAGSFCWGSDTVRSAWVVYAGVLGSFGLTRFVDAGVRVQLGRFGWFMLRFGSTRVSSGCFTRGLRSARVVYAGPRGHSGRLGFLCWRSGASLRLLGKIGWSAFILLSGMRCVCWRGSWLLSCIEVCVLPKW